MSRLRNTLLGLSAVAAAGSLTLLVAPAGAAPQAPPVSGDPRATAYAGNIKDGDCAAAGLAGSKIEVTYTIEGGTDVTITAVPAGTTLTGVVVKGGAAYNVYAGNLLTGLHAPLVPSGGPAGISHWFACGTTTTTSPSPTPSATSPSPTPSETSPSPSPSATSPSPSETSPSPTPSETSPSPTPSETSPSPSETSPSSSPSGTTTPTPTETSPAVTVVPPTTTPPAVGGAVPPTTPPTSPGLALTGSSTTAVAGLGLALLLAGAALLTLPGVRRRLLG